jgi:hypothetical protein
MSPTIVLPRIFRRRSGAAGSFTESYQKFVNVVAWGFLACSAIAAVEPSPYDLASLVAMPIWAFGGFRIHRSFILLYFILVGKTVATYLALVPYWDSPDSTIYEYQSTYLVVTGFFFALFMSERTHQRAQVLLTAYSFSAVISAAAGILGYFDIANTGEIFSMYGRASGTFKDPNVFGPFLIPSTLYFMQNILLGRARSTILTLVPIVVLMAGIFLSFSRGAWGATILASLLMVGSAFATTPNPRLRARIATLALVAVAAAVIVVLALLSNLSTSAFFAQRATLEEDYDSGETGRFGNQLRSIPLLLDRFFGFGPLRYRLTFGLDPHNAYIGNFADGGWLAGLFYILLVSVTIFIGFRLMWRTSPFQRLAQIFFPPLLSIYAQGFQIDVDHWRHTYILMGSVWGLEAARRKWVAGERDPSDLDHASAPARSARP